MKTCVNCGCEIPKEWHICTTCRAFLNSIMNDFPQRIRCILCQEKAHKILLHTQNETLADIAWSQCEGSKVPNEHCMLWNAALEAEYEARNRYA